MKYIKLAAGLFFFSLAAIAHATVWKQPKWEYHISEAGYLKQIVFKNKQSNDTIPFFTEGINQGPSFYAVIDGTEKQSKWIPNGHYSYRASIEGVSCELTYKEWKGQPALEVVLRNEGKVPFQPEKAGLKLGIDTYMDKYPEWFNQFFPTLMRNETSHFYGYLQSPSGKMIGIISPQPIAAWSVSYNKGYQDPAPHWFMGHRIESLNLDLMNTLPLPAHHPQNLWQLQKGEEKGGS